MSSTLWLNHDCFLHLSEQALVSLAEVVVDHFLQCTPVLDEDSLEAIFHIKQFLALLVVLVLKYVFEWLVK